MAYLDPVKTIARFSSNDYEAPPNLDELTQSHLSELFDDVKYEAIEYALTTSSGVGNAAMQNSTLPVGEALPEDEQIYEDPGHIKEEIYEWFKQKNICRIYKNSIR